MNQDPIKLSGGDNLYQFAPSSQRWIDVLGLLKVYRYMSLEDLADFNAGRAIASKGTGGTIAEHVIGQKNTQYISASLSKKGAAKYNSGHGLLEIDVDVAKKHGAKFIDHGNVMQALEGEKKKCSKKDRSRLQQAQQDAKKAEEVLFISKIPFEALRLIK